MVAGHGRFDHGLFRHRNSDRFYGKQLIQRSFKEFPCLHKFIRVRGAVPGGRGDLVLHPDAGQVQDKLACLADVSKGVSRFLAEAAQIRSRGGRMGITHDQGAILRTPSRLMVEIKLTGNGMSPSRINGLNSKACPFLSKKNHESPPLHGRYHLRGVG